MIKRMLTYFNNLHPPLSGLADIQADMLMVAQAERNIINRLVYLQNSNYQIKSIIKFASRVKQQQINFLVISMTLYQLFNYRHEIQHQIQNLFTPKETPTVIVKQHFLSQIVIREVLQKQHIVDQLVSVIERVDQKQSTVHNVAKQLTKIYQIPDLYDKIYTLTQQLVIREVLYSKDIQNKLRDVLMRVLLDQQDQISRILCDVIQQAEKPCGEALTNLFNMQGVQQAIADGASMVINEQMTENNAVEILKYLSK